MFLLLQRFNEKFFSIDEEKNYACSVYMPTILRLLFEDEHFLAA